MENKCRIEIKVTDLDEIQALLWIKLFNFIPI